MLDPRMEERLNLHINAEFYASYLYLSMSAHFDAEGLTGFAHWLKKQSEEEYGHALRVYGYVNERGGRVRLKAIAEPKAEFASYRELFEDVYAHERKVSGLIHDLMDLAIQMKDHATQAFLQWFVSEQVEEEAMASNILQKVARISDSGPGLLALDRDLGSR